MAIVVTNGCFDGGLHAGHIRLLSKCRELAGDLGTVTVLLNSDKSVRRLKGEGRPIYPLEDRRESLLAMKAVDHVISFDSEEELAGIYRKLSPDILVKGPPWKECQLTGQEFCGKIVVLESLAAASTSAVHGAPSIEVINPRHPAGPFDAAVFDFDGTLSLLRDGWQAVMTRMMLDELGDNALDSIREMIAETTGKQTIHQMIWLANEVAKQQNDALLPGEYKAVFCERMNSVVQRRKLGSNSADMLVRGATSVLQKLRCKGTKCYLASGTDLQSVREEAAWLGIATFFDGIRGAEADSTDCPKKSLFAWLKEQGKKVVSFGDGPVEIREAKAIGALAVGIVREDNRERLIQAGADILIPDYAREMLFLG